jgi:hypothetical protein
MADINPYQSPLTVEARAPRGSAPWGALYQSAHTRAIFAMALLGIAMFMGLLDIYSNWLQYNLLDQIKHGKQFLPATLEANDTRHAAIVGGELIVFVLTAIAFLMWTYRAYKNLPALGAHNLEQSPGWAVGWYFVPFANLIKPYYVMVEIVRHSNPEGIGVNARASSTANVGRWWAAYIISGIVGWIAGTTLSSGAASHSIDSMMTGVGIGMVGKAINIVAALLAILLIARVDKEQEQRFQVVTSQVTDQASAAHSPGFF